MDARLNHGGAPQFPATESDLDPEMVAIAGASVTLSGAAGEGAAGGVGGAA